MNSTNDRKTILTDYQDIFDNNAPQIANLVFQCSLFILGLFLQNKIYHVYNAERSKTWHIHTSHAIIISINWLFRIPFETVTYFVPNLSSVIGSWICFLVFWFACERFVPHALSRLGILL